MAKKSNPLKYQRYHQLSGKIEVKLRDSVDRPTYKSQAYINQVKEIARIIVELEELGVPIKKAVKYVSYNNNDDYWEL